MMRARVITDTAMSGRSNYIGPFSCQISSGRVSVDIQKYSTLTRIDSVLIK